METRYISLEAAINLIQENIIARRELVSDARGEIQGLNVAMCRIEGIPAADVVPAPRWIPVTEQFPPLDKEVLVFAIGLPEWGFEGKTTTAIAYRFTYRFWSGGKEYEQWSTPWEHFHKDYKITHWMPLPEPPEEGATSNG